MHQFQSNNETQNLPPFVEKFLKMYNIRVEPMTQNNAMRMRKPRNTLEKSVDSLIQARTSKKITRDYWSFVRFTFVAPSVLQHDYQQFIFPFFVHLALQLFQLGKTEEAKKFIQKFRGLQPPQCEALIKQLEIEQQSFKPPHFNILMNQHALDELMVNIEKNKQVLLSFIITTNINVTAAPFSHPILFLDAPSDSIALSSSTSEQTNNNEQSSSTDILSKIPKEPYLSTQYNTILSDFNNVNNGDDFFSFAQIPERLQYPILVPIPESKYMPPSLSVIFHPQTPDKQPSIDQRPDGTIYLTQALPDVAHVVQYNHNNRINDMCVSRCARLHAMAQDSSVVISALDTSTCVNNASSSVLTNHAGKVLTVAFSNDSRYVVSGGMDCQIKVAHVEAFRPLAHFRNHLKPILSVAWDSRRNSTYFAGCSMDQTTTLWNISTPTVLRMFIGHTLPVSKVAFSRDGSSIITCSNDLSVRVWDIGTGRMITKLNCGRSVPLAVDVHPNNQLVACGCDDGTVMLWDCSKSPTDARTLWCNKKAFDNRVTDVKFTQDGSLLLGSCIDGSLNAFNLKERERGSSAVVEIYNNENDNNDNNDDNNNDNNTSDNNGVTSGDFGDVVMRTEAYASTIDSITVTDYNLVCTTGRSLRGNVSI
ncbi:hypothetical protein M9Y10_044792 [Tritrichomonas musculus]|uniref:TFIID subunit TAF5 NTD2 domain-containing protein n=1 Tax=Tritrichomonas musculus TaxID=1915356 RepID=A0ABR2JV82_9EUKA